jgi:hypothetical protein
MRASDREVAPQVVQHPGARPTERMQTVDSIKSSVFRLTDAREDTHLHACTDGIVFLTYTAFDPEVGDEVEKIEAIPCRRCAHSR